MKQGMQSNRGRLALVAAAAVLIVAAVILAIKLGGGNDAAAQLDSAVAFLRQLESGDPDQVVEVIRQQQRARLAAERDEMRDRLVNGEIDVWSQFQDSVILGDSRASGFYYYSFLPRETVIAEPGDTIWTIEDNLDAVEALHPGRAFIAYGANDMGYWSTPSDFTAEFARILDELEARLPGIEIYISSILPVESWVTNSSLQNIPAYNEALQTMCREKGYTYVDNDALTAEHPDLYEVDGIHFKGAFYPYWASNLILAAYYRDAEGNGT